MQALRATANTPTCTDQRPGAGAAATALAGWTQDGGGLVVLGSENSLPPGGYGNATIDALLPVDLRVAPGARAPAAATVVAIDKSGSMADVVNGVQLPSGDMNRVDLVRAPSTNQMLSWSCVELLGSALCSTVSDASSASIVAPAVEVSPFSCS